MYLCKDILLNAVQNPAITALFNVKDEDVLVHLLQIYNDDVDGNTSVGGSDADSDIGNLKDFEPAPDAPVPDEWEGKLILEDDAGTPCDKSKQQTTDAGYPREGSGLLALTRYFK